MLHTSQQTPGFAAKNRALFWKTLLSGGVLFTVGCGQSASDTAGPTASSPSATSPHPLSELEQDDLAQIDQLDQFDQAGAHPTTLTVQKASQTNLRLNAPANSADNPLGMAADLSGQASSGTPEWDIQQIAAIQLEAQKAASTAARRGHQLQLSDAHNRKIVALASHAISQTHNAPQKELLFNTAVQSLVDARIGLALAGDQQSLESLYEDAATLAEKHPGSTAAATASRGVVRLAEAMATQADRQSPWVSEYVRQAKLFAANFPAEEARAIVQLTAAAEFCEQQQLLLPAIECYTFIQQKFPNSPFNQRAEAALLRLNLVGKTCPIEGPALSGKHVQLSDYVGKPVLVAFWSSRSDAFQEDLPMIQDLCQRSGCQLIGINMDTNEQTVQEFVTSQQLLGEHIFYSEASFRGASQPLARQFGIHIVPTYWLIDKQGKVLSTCVSREQLRSLTGAAK